MLHALTVVLASDEPNKTGFYIGAGAFAFFAIALGALGMTQPDFPKTEGAARGVMALAGVLMLAAMVTAIATS